MAEITREMANTRRKFEGMDLRWMDLSNLDLRWATFSRANLQGADLRGAALRWTCFDEAVLSGACFDGADLRETSFACADLTGATGLPAAPVVEGLHQKILAAIEERPETFWMAAWHDSIYKDDEAYELANPCGIRHCRAGWAIYLAGEAGYALEARLGPNVTGTLITMASCPWLERVPNWFADDEVALEDIKRCAAIERQMEA